MFTDLLESMRVIALPTKTNFRGISLREVALFRGEYGWGEFSPFIEYDDKEAASWLAAAVEAATQPRLPRLRNAIPVNGTIPATNDKELIKRLVASYPGVKTFKVKVGANLSEDIVRLARIRTLGRDINIRIDVNGSWNVDEALRNLYAMYEEIGPFQYVEQPVATIEEMRELKERIRIPLTIAADEVLRKAVDPFAIDLNGAADVLMLKVQPLGGMRRAIALAEHHELPVVVSSALESAVGIHYGLELASSLPLLNFDCGLATGSLMAANVAELPIENGAIALRDIDIEIAGLEVAPDRYEWWKNRAMRCAKELGIS